MSEARAVSDAGYERVQADATVGAYEVRQAPSGKAGVLDRAASVAAGAYFDLTTVGQFSVKKNTAVVFLKGGRVYWDHSANEATYRRVNDRDFYVGRAVEDTTSAAPTVRVELNTDPRYDVELARDGFVSVLAGTPAAGGFGYPVNLGGTLVFEIGSANEAQKVDALAVDGFSPAANAIVEGAFRVISDGAGTVVDVSVGVASGTHATDADAIAEHCLVHLDANNTNINVQSRDGTTTVAATDTTTDYTEGSAVASRVEFWMDFRDPADVQVYVNGANVLPASVFNLGAAAGPLFPLVHAEKTVATDTYKLAVDWLRVRTAEQ